MNVILKKNSSGIVILTDDDAQDEIAGPFPDELAASDAAKAMGLKIQPQFKFVTGRTSKTTKHVKDLQPRDLFRVENLWYRVIEHKGKETLLDVVGQKRQDTLPGSTEISEVSVLSLR